MTTNFVNYAQILSDFQTALAAATLINGCTLKKVYKNASDTDFQYENMPLADCRWKGASPQDLTTANAYYMDATLEVEIACQDMISRDNCATIRDNLVNAVQRFTQLNPRFSSFVDTVVIGPAVFETGETSAQGEFIAAAIMQFHVRLYSET